MAYQQQSNAVPTLPLSSVPFGGSNGYPSGQGVEVRRPYSAAGYHLERTRGISHQQGVEEFRAREQYFPTDRSPNVAASSSSPFSRSFGANGSFGNGNAAAFSATAERERLKKFSSTRTNTLRPVIFQPNGSFRALKENGKLTVGEDEKDLYKGRVKNPLSDTAYHLPGYTGFVRGAQHISGRTFGETSRRALSTDYREIVSTSPIPSSPQANRKIRHEELKDTFVANMFGGKTQQIPGYTGFVPGVRSTYAKRYGAATEQEMLAHAARFPRRDNQPANFARTQLPREYYPVSSAPLPGGSPTQSPPEMWIPEHIRYLKFFPQ